MVTFQVANPLSHKENHPFYSLSIVKHRKRCIKRYKNKKNMVHEFVSKVNRMCYASEIYRYIKSSKKVIINHIISLCYGGRFLSCFSETNKRMVLSVLCSIKHHNTNQQIMVNRTSITSTISTDYMQSVLDTISCNKTQL